MKTLLELKMLKKKAQLDNDEELEKWCDQEILKIILKSNENGIREEKKQKAIERRRRYAKKK